MHGQDISQEILARVLEAIDSGRALRIVGGDSKAFYGGTCLAEQELNLAGHSGVIDYEPSELVITARAGSRLRDISRLLAEHGQMLAFEPPSFGDRASLGGTMACGFSGPGRLFAGAARDYMLGCKIVNGHGEILNFGGRVIKNVAGFDVSRLMVGALGSLGVLLELSIRVHPLPAATLTLTHEMAAEPALNRMTALPGKAWPLSALAYDGERLRVRLSGAEAAIAAAKLELGGDIDKSGDKFWLDLNEQQLPFFHQPGDLWRISVAAATPPLNLPGAWLLDWGGALRWLKTESKADEIHSAARSAGGYAVCFRGRDKSQWLQLDTGLLNLQQRVRTAFDPHKLFNPGRLHD